MRTLYSLSSPMTKIRRIDNLNSRAHANDNYDNNFIMITINMYTYFLYDEYEIYLYAIRRLHLVSYVQDTETQKQLRILFTYEYLNDRYRHGLLYEKTPTRSIDRQQFEQYFICSSELRRTIIT